MQSHPDRSELKLYLRGNAPAPVATVIKQHLMVCDKCVGDALVVYDELDQARAVLSKRDMGTDLPPVTALVPASQATIVVDARKTWRYEWAALVPIALAAGLMWTTRVPTDSTHPVRARIAASEDRQLLASLPIQTESVAEEDLRPVATDDSSNNDFNEVAQPVKRRSATPQVRETRVAKVFIFAAQRPRSSDPVLLQPIDPVHVSYRNYAVHKPAALALVARQPYLAPPPQRPAGMRKFFSVLAAPFRKSS